MDAELLSLEQYFWRLDAIRIVDGKRVLLTDRVPGPALMAYRRMGGAL